jgi:hypothetical protein
VEKIANMDEAGRQDASSKPSAGVSPLSFSIELVRGGGYRRSEGAAGALLDPG